MKFTHNRLIEYYKTLSKRHYCSYFVFLQKATLFGKSCPITLAYRSTSKYIFLEYCYPLTKEQYELLETNKVEGFKSKNMESGHKVYLDCYFAYASLQFTMYGGLDFNAAFGYLTRMLEKHLTILMEDK